MHGQCPRYGNPTPYRQNHCRRQRFETVKSNEFRWLLDGTERTPTWQNCHFAPIFIRRKAEEQEKSYYFVGSAVALDDVHASVNPGEDGSESKVVISTLKLNKPVDPELYRHLTGKSAL
ncbi:DUF3427 domain-containing protein [Bifidobacterium adolescentis]|uniref:DUF3427 domain-containing protein n=1 Tax=Bifidobacterium adolescentis TaxID=1680 RepID=UPI003BB4A295